VLVLQGQWSGLFALSLALGYRELRRGHENWAAFWLLAPVFAVKPNLALGLFAFVMGWSGRRMLGGALAAVAVVLVSSLLVGGPSIFGAFLHADLGSRSLWPLASMAGITGITGWLLGSTDSADVIGFAACIAVAAVAFPLGRIGRATGRLEPTLAAAVALTLLASPHLFPHALAMLTPVTVWFMAWAYQRDTRDVARLIPRRLLAVTVGWTAFNVVAAVEPRLASGKLVPWFLLAGCLARRRIRFMGKG
jgi:hypothetical protein